MKITVTPIDIHPTEGHPESHQSYGESIVGKSWVSITTSGVWLDGKRVIVKDRRTKDHQPGHPWLTSRRRPNDNRFEINWTGFRVEVEA